MNPQGDKALWNSRGGKGVMDPRGAMLYVPLGEKVLWTPRKARPYEPPEAGGRCVITLYHQQRATPLILLETPRTIGDP